MRAFAGALVLASGVTAENGVEPNAGLTRVVNLLKGIQTRLAEEKETDQTSYDRYACWVKETVTNRARDIKQANANIQEYSRKINMHKSNVAAQTQIIAKKIAQIDDITRTQQEIDETRAKENAAYQADKAEWVGLIEATYKAVGVLKSGGGGNLLQVQKVVDGALAMSSVPEQHKVALLQIKEGKYTPQSATIVGIVKDLYDTFAYDLQKAGAEDAKKRGYYEKETYFNTEQRKGYEADKLAAEKEKATAMERQAEFEEKLENTTEQRDDNVKIFDDTKEEGTKKSAEYKRRVDLRDIDIKGVKDALEYLESKDTRDKFNALNDSRKAASDSYDANTKQNAQDHFDRKKTNNYNVENSQNKHTEQSNFSFIQTSSTQQNMNKALRLLKNKTGFTVSSVGAGVFQTLVSKIDQLVGELEENQTQDNKKKNLCVENLSRYNKRILKEKDQIEANELVINQKKARISQAEADIKGYTAGIEANEDAKEAARKQRGETHTAFKTHEQDTEAMIDILQETKRILVKVGTDKADVEKDAVQGVDVARKGDVNSGFDTQFGNKSQEDQSTSGVIKLLTNLVDRFSNEVEALRETEREDIAAFGKLEKDIQDDNAQYLKQLDQAKMRKAENEQDLAIENIKKGKNVKQLELVEQFKQYEKQADPKNLQGELYIDDGANNKSIDSYLSRNADHGSAAGTASVEEGKEAKVGGTFDVAAGTTKKESTYTPFTDDDKAAVKGEYYKKGPDGSIIVFKRDGDNYTQQDYWFVPEEQKNWKVGKDEIAGDHYKKVEASTEVTEWYGDCEYFVSAKSERTPEGVTGFQERQKARWSERDALLSAKQYLQTNLISTNPPASMIQTVQKAAALIQQSRGFLGRK